MIQVNRLQSNSNQITAASDTRSERTILTNKAKACLPKLVRFVPRHQLETMLENLYREDWSFFAKKLIELTETIENMPHTYETDGQGDDAIVHLHYFGGSFDSWITEKDKLPIQHQAFGYVTMFGPETAELGYTSIQEYLDTAAELAKKPLSPNIEIDLFWTPKTVGEIRKQLHERL